MGWVPGSRGSLVRRQDTSYTEIKVEVLVWTVFVSEHMCVWICVCPVCMQMFVLVCVREWIRRSFQMNNLYIVISVLIVMGDKLIYSEYNDVWKIPRELCKLEWWLSQMGDSGQCYALVKIRLHILLRKLNWEAHLLFSLHCLEFSNNSKIYTLKEFCVCCFH